MVLLVGGELFSIDARVQVVLPAILAELGRELVAKEDAVHLRRNVLELSVEMLEELFEEVVLLGGPFDSVQFLHQV